MRVARNLFEMNIYVIRVVFSYVTFYHARIPKEYWNELAVGCPRRQSITVDRYPGDDSDPLNGFDLATPEGREAVINALCKIRERIRT